MAENTTTINKRQKFTVPQVLRFVVFSLIGGGAFLCPLPQQDGSLVIPISLIIDWVNQKASGWIIYTAIAVVIISALCSVLASVLKIPFFPEV